MLPALEGHAFCPFVPSYRTGNRRNRRKIPLSASFLTRRIRGKALLNYHFDFAHGLHAVPGTDPIERPELVDLAVRDRHTTGELIDRVARRDLHDAQPQRLGLVDFGQAHTAECADGLAEKVIGFWRKVLGGENEAVHVAAKTYGVEAEIPIV